MEGKIIQIKAEEERTLITVEMDVEYFGRAFAMMRGYEVVNIIAVGYCLEYPRNLLVEELK